MNNLKKLNNLKKYHSKIMLKLMGSKKVEQLDTIDTITPME